MAYSEPARTAARRTVYGHRRHRVLPGGVLALLLAYTALTAASHSLNNGRGSVSAVSWPLQGQAALVLGNARLAASPGEQPAPIASLAKVMTAYLTLERYPLSGAQDGFTVAVTATQAQDDAQDTAENQSDAAVAAGEQLTERQLLEALLIPSGNNIARILAAEVAGSETSFVAEMNVEARALGMDHTIYTDPSGFDPGTVSTAADQLRVFEQAMRFPVFRQIVSMPSVTLPVAGTLTNFNPLIADGYAGKTGSDSAAAGCLAFFTHATIGARELTAAGVVLGQGQGSNTSGSSPPRARPPSGWSTPSTQRPAHRRSPRLSGLVPRTRTAARSYSLPGRRALELMSMETTTAGEHMNEIRRPLAALALIGISALLSACGSSAPADSGSASNASTAHAQAVKFAGCMRSNGVGAFPDPSGSGGFTIDEVVNGSSLDPNAPAFKQAISACKSLEPAGFTGAKVTPEQAAARLKFAQCIRANGVPDFPDPTPNGPLVDTNRIPSASQPGGMSALHAAMQKCRDVAAAAGVTR